VIIFTTMPAAWQVRTALMARGARRIDHADQAEEGQVAAERRLVSSGDFAVRPGGARASASTRRPRAAIRAAADRFQRRGVERRFAAVGGEHGAAGGQQLFDGALDVGDRSAFDLVQRGHGLARRIEGQFVRRGNALRSVVSSRPPLRATTSSAASVGSPVICHCRCSW
jgi:hypothetical protein